MDDATRNYLQRWQMVEQVERQELADSSFELRWKQLNSLFQMAAALGILPVRDEDQENQVFQQWAKLKSSQ